MSRIATVFLCVLIAIAATATSVGHAAAHFDDAFVNVADGHDHHHAGHLDDVDDTDEGDAFSPSGDHAVEFHLVAVMADEPVYTAGQWSEAPFVTERTGVPARSGFRDPDPD